jgi:outer membrane protein TolC
MRGAAIGWGLVLVFAALPGCKQQCFIAESEYDRCQGMLPLHLECSAATPMQPEAVNVPEPATVLDPERPVRHLALAEAISMALENGNVGGGVSLGFIFSQEGDPLIDIPFRFNGFNRDSIRVLALQPAVAYTDVESALSRFDVRWLTSMEWQNTDRPVGNPLDTFQAQGLVNTIQQNLANFNTSLVKALPSGGVAGITFGTTYELSNLNPRVNPSYRPTLEFAVEQPLLQGFGTEINQIRAAHPGSVLFPASFATQAGQGILITRLRFDQERTDFEFNVMYMVFLVERAYWKLYFAYGELYAQEQGLIQAFRTYRINQANLEAGRASIVPPAQSRAQYERFRGDRLAAMGRVLDAERTLRGLLNMPVEDGTRLVPVDTPTLAPYQPDWQAALDEAMALQPSLILARQDLKISQLNLISQKNQLLPDLRFTGTYDYNAIGPRLDGPTALNALRVLSNGDFSNWSLGLQANIPLGYRDAHAGVRRARLQLEQSYLELRDQEMKVQRFLARVYRNLAEFQQRIQAARVEREMYGQELAARWDEVRVGRKVPDEFLLQAQRNWAFALTQEYRNIVDYNIALAAFQFAKGTMLQYNNVVISEGALPNCAQVRAVEHFRERAAALVCHEHALPKEPVNCCTGHDLPLPTIPKEPPALPALLLGKPIPELNEPISRQDSSDR